MMRRFIYSLFSLLSLAIVEPVWGQVIVGSTSSGSLVESGFGGRRLESSAATQFTVTVEAGTPNVSIQILPPTFVSGPSTDPGGTIRTATAHINGVIITSGSLNNVTSLPVGLTTVGINMQVERPALFPAGIYQYAVDVMILPN